MRRTIEAWRHDYNHRRPHSSLGALTPTEFAVLKRPAIEATPTATPATPEAGPSVSIVTPAPREWLHGKVPYQIIVSTGAYRQFEYTSPVNESWSPGILRSIGRNSAGSRLHSDVWQRRRKAPAISKSTSPKYSVSSDIRKARAAMEP